MKIAINGTIIDTKDIYQITSIEEQSVFGQIGIGLMFTIKFFNQESIDIFLKHSLYFSNNDLCTLKGCTKIIKINASLDDLRNHPDYIQCKSKLNEFRDRIVKVWSENQSPIPQFNLEP